MCSSLRGNNFVAVLLCLIGVAAFASADNIAPVPECPAVITIKNKQIVTEDGWMASTHANRRDSPERYPLVDGTYKTRSNAPEIAEFDIRTQKVNPVECDNLDEFIDAGESGADTPTAYWVLRSSENEKWAYFCSADYRSLLLYKFVPAGIKKCSYIVPKKKSPAWGDAKLVCE